VVASALWHFEPTLDAAITAFKAGSFKAEMVILFMKAGGSLRRRYRLRPIPDDVSQVAPRLMKSGAARLHDDNNPNPPDGHGQYNSRRTKPFSGFPDASGLAHC
jgi:hypothetical protein